MAENKRPASTDPEQLSLDAEALLAQDQPVLASCYGAATEGKVLLGERPSQRTTRLVRPDDARPDEPASSLGSPHGLVKRMP